MSSVLGKFLRFLFSAPDQAEHGEGGCGDHHNGPGPGQSYGRRLQPGHKAGPAAAERLGQPGAEAAVGGQDLDFVQGDVHGAVIDLLCVPVQLALIAFDLVLHIA